MHSTTLNDLEKGYNPCKILTLGQKLKFRKLTQNAFYKSFRNVSIFQKWQYFRNRPLCKRYSPSKILTLGQQLKFQKTGQNPLYKSFRVVLRKKTASKNTKYSRNEVILKISHHAKAIAHAKSSFDANNENSKKHVKLHCTNHLKLFFAKNRSKKN